MSNRAAAWRWIAGYTPLLFSAASRPAAHLAMGYTVNNVIPYLDNQERVHLRAYETKNRQAKIKAINSCTAQPGRKGEPFLAFETGGYASREEALTHSEAFLQFLRQRNDARGTSHRHLPSHFPHPGRVSHSVSLNASRSIASTATRKSVVGLRL